MGTKNYTHIKKYGPFRGLNKGVSDLNLQEEFFSLAKNAFITPGSTALTSRPGFKPTALDPTSSDVKVFAGLYIETDIVTGDQFERELVLNLTQSNAEVIKELDLTISNVGAVDAYAEINFNEATLLWQFQLTNASTGAVLQTVSLDSSAGIPSVTIGSLISTINGYADFNCVSSDSSVTSPKASMVLPAMKELIPAGTSRVVRGFYPKTIDYCSVIIDAYAPFYEGPNAAPISYTNINNVLMFALPGVGVCKFDGQSLSRVGAPVPTRISTLSVSGVGGGITAGLYSYALAYEKRDVKGNVIEGLGEITRGNTTSTLVSSLGGPGYATTTGASSSITFTINDLNSLNEFDIRGAVFNGAQTFSSSDLVFTVDSGHNLMAGDRVCFFIVVVSAANGNMDAFVSAVVSSVTATTITLSPDNWTLEVRTSNGAARPDIKTQSYFVQKFVEQTDITISELTAWADVGGLSVADNDIISNNFRINIYRNKGAGLSTLTTYPGMFLLDSLPVAFNATQSYTDTYADSALTIPWDQKTDIGPIPFETEYGVLPKGIIVHNHQNRIYVAGTNDAPNTLYRSDVLSGPEFHDFSGAADLNLETKVASVITAIGSTSDNLVVGKSRGIKIISGDLGSDTNIRVDDLSFELGLANQASTVSAVDKCIGLTQLGPIEISTNGAWNFLGSQDLGGKSRLEGVLKNGSYDLNFASSAVNPEKGFYYLYIPNKGTVGATEDENESFLQFDQGAALTANATFGSAYVYSMTQDAWFEWTNVDGSGGAYVKDGLFHAVKTGDLGSIILKESASGTMNDKVDWFQAISFDVATNWMTLGEAFLFKQFLRALIQNIETSPLADDSFTLTLSAEKDWVETMQSSIDVPNLGAVGYGQLKIKGNKSRSMRIRMQHSALKKAPLITGLTVEIAAPFAPKVKER